MKSDASRPSSLEPRALKIVADENIPLVRECFAGLGDVVTLPGRSLTADDLAGADVLVARSVTKVNKELIQNSSLKFVGTCTAGCDHIELPALKEQGVGFSNAPGCNARSVVEYVLCALDILAERDGYCITGRTVGIVGKGQVGGRLYRALQALGVRVMANDPLLEAEAGVELVELDELLERCDVIALHTPLTTSGDYPTYHLFGEQQLLAMKHGTVLINAGRGAVVDNRALLNVLKARDDLSVVLDVWEHEPEVDPELLELVDIGTPHIAGYSLDAKVTGTVMVYQALCRFLGLPARTSQQDLTPLPPLMKLDFTGTVDADQAASVAMRATYDIRRDDALMRRLLKMEPEARKLAFDFMRKNYSERREFSTLKIDASRSSQEVQQRLQALGFDVLDE
ncbi:4-phosphoerythronate dehydrogenase PdxB [Endozoicomonas euniceicola]|uniref:Erythronate-4-phosphate dehydrogenase n=1 Tax=Endozoicomonas euniceicola TaxID=1234143 RepID=A0ABY6GWV9_9GAMM|nr:4-phosphoerythronate dehydrogenase PdxB [Endozoicomonas euniceicola]UYM17042.1 4-phosphoerythronate dehydrogenase PdxB [Endozoicomonas euniceicola]